MRPINYKITNSSSSAKITTCAPRAEKVGEWGRTCEDKLLLFSHVRVRSSLYRGSVVTSRVGDWGGELSKEEDTTLGDLQWEER